MVKEMSGALLCCVGWDEEDSAASRAAYLAISLCSSSSRFELSSILLVMKGLPEEGTEWEKSVSFMLVTGLGGTI